MAKVLSHSEQVQKAISVLEKKGVISTVAFSAEVIGEIADGLLGQPVTADDGSVSYPNSRIDDFTAGLSEKPEYDNPVVILSYVKEADRFRIAIVPNAEHMLTVKAVAQRAYEMLLASVFRNAKSPDVSAAKFQSPLAAVLPKISEKPFAVIAPQFLKFIQSQVKGAKQSPYKSLTVSTLRSCFASEASAKALMPKVPDETWDKALGACKKLAVKNGLDTLCFDNWLAGRHLVADTTAPAQELDFGGVEAISLDKPDKTTSGEAVNEQPLTESSEPTGETQSAPAA